MDVSIIASVGSFVVSERVLKPKATVLVILGCVLAYDLNTKTHDTSSLRVYRGPALLAFTLMMAAYSLRTWRRNGVACDELIFLPGTAHGQRHGIDTAVMRSETNAHDPRSEGDVAAGVGFRLQPDAGQHQHVEIIPGAGLLTRTMRARTLSHESSISSIQAFVNSWEEDDDDDEDDNDEEGESLMAPLNVTADEEGSSEMNGRSQRMSFDVDASETRANTAETGPVQRFRQNHPRISRLGSFFFFRNSVPSTHLHDYAPSGPSVFGAALDLSMPILFNFHLFIEAYNHIDSYQSETPAKVLPLIFLTVLIVRSFLPPGKRGRFWSTMKYTFTAPFHRCRFRDAFIGDFLTSLVRPLQDVMFALSYYFTVIYGTVSGQYGLSASGRILESSWILHNVVLPSVALLPLWWKYLQTLRQAYDTGKRWPYLGNAFKYLTASQVIMYGMTHPEDRRSSWWIVCYILCLLYQLWWDTFMDWELFVIAPRPDETSEVKCSISSYRPNSYVLPLQMTCLRPVQAFLRQAWMCISCYRQFQLRPRRLYKSDTFYWRIFAYNTVMRFTWMLCFIPAYRLSGHGHLNTFSSDTNSYIGVLLPIAEIVRRALWGLLLLENETLKMQEGNPNFSREYSRVDVSEDGILIPDESRRSVESIDSDTKGRLIPQEMFSVFTRLIPQSWTDLDQDTRGKLYVAELSLWAAVFVGLALWTLDGAG